MKFFLPYLHLFRFPPQYSSKGFTLIELLIVITIIAIIGAIAYATLGANFFNSPQKARDAKRRADIAAIGKTLEAQKSSSFIGTNDFGSGTVTDYTLTTTMFTTNALPSDPLGSTTRNYCMITSATVGQTWATPTSPWTTTTCPSPTTSTFGTFTGQKAYLICASLESGSVVCTKNQT